MFLRSEVLQSMLNRKDRIIRNSISKYQCWCYTLWALITAGGYYSNGSKFWVHQCGWVDQPTSGTSLKFINFKRLKTWQISGRRRTFPVHKPCWCKSHVSWLSDSPVSMCPLTGTNVTLVIDTSLLVSSPEPHHAICPTRSMGTKIQNISFKIFKYV